MDPTTVRPTTVRPPKRPIVRPPKRPIERPPIVKPYTVNNA